MKKVPFKKIDAFARGNSSGNPAAVVTLNMAEELTDSEMLRIAQQLKGFVSEVAYIWERPQGGYRLRYFSSEREVAFCGHATIATMHDLLSATSRQDDTSTVTIEVNSGELTVLNRIAEEDAVFITAPKAVYSSQEIDPAPLQKALGISQNVLSTTQGPSIINAGLETLIVPIKGLSQILSLSPDLETLNLYCKSIGVDIIILWSDEVQFADNSYRTRVFAPTFGYLEDPATGSGNAAFAYYLLRENLWDGHVITIEQNGDRKNPNIVKVQSTDCTKNEYIVFGGGAVKRIEGHYFI